MAAVLSCGFPSSSVPFLLSPPSPPRTTLHYLSEVFLFSIPFPLFPRVRTGALGKPDFADGPIQGTVLLTLDHLSPVRPTTPQFFPLPPCFQDRSSMVTRNYGSGNEQILLLLRMGLGSLVSSLSSTLPRGIRGHRSLVPFNGFPEFQRWSPPPKLLLLLPLCLEKRCAALTFLRPWW